MQGREQCQHWLVGGPTGDRQGCSHVPSSGVPPPVREGVGWGQGPEFGAPLVVGGESFSLGCPWSWRDESSDPNSCVWQKGPGAGME